MAENITTIQIDDDLAAIIDQVAEMLRPIAGGDRSPGEFTTEEYATRRGIASNTASRLLKEAVNQGKLERRRAALPGHPWLYRVKTG
jgi:hypothetical protein